MSALFLFFCKEFFVRPRTKVKTRKFRFPVFPVNSDLINENQLITHISKYFLMYSLT